MKLLPLLLAALPTLAQPPAPVPSPFAIREEILRKGDAYDMPALMRQLGLPEKLYSGSYDFNCQRSACSAEVFPFDEAVLGSHGSYVLNLCSDSGGSCRLIAFHGSGLRDSDENWRIAGSNDANDKYGVTIDRHYPWFTINRLYGTGTGVVSYHREWFTLTETAFRSVLNTVSYGRDMNANPQRFWRGQFMDYGQYSTPVTVTFLYFIEFRDKESEMKLFDERRLVTFSRESPDARFKYDPSRSELSLEEIEAFYEFDNDIPPAQLLSFARASLLRLARSGDNAQKRWLANYLAAAPASAVKTELLRALAPKADK